MVAGISTPVLVHVCYGYDYAISEKSPSPAYAECLSLLARCNIWGMSLEYEQLRHMPDLLTHCRDKQVVLGLLNLSTEEEIETPEHIAQQLGTAAKVVPLDRLHAAPDCGMWHLSRDVAFAKLRSLVLGMELVRRTVM